MACFSARVRIYKALLGLDFFDGRWAGFCRLGEGGVSKALWGGYGRYRFREQARSHIWIGVCLEGWFFAARTISCGE